jgi:UDP-glucose 4-epimerase
VEDLAQAHLIGLERLLSGEAGGQYNLGNGEGHSVKEVIEIARNITGRPIPVRVVQRRKGDPAVLISSSEKAIRHLGWRPQFPGLEAVIETAWNWHKVNPNGYG